MFAISGWGVRCWERERFRVLRFDYDVRVEICTLSGSGSGTISEYPVCKATGRIARELARCTAMVSGNGFKGE